VIIAVARAGFVANSTPSGTPASRQRSASSVPGSWQVQGAVDEGMAAARGVGQVDCDLGVLDPPGRAGVLPLHADAALALLQITRLVNDRDRVRLAERVDHVVAQIFTHGVGVPLRARQQMLQPVRRHVTALLRDRPAVLAVQPGQHAKHQPAGVPQRLVAREPRLDAIQHHAVRRPPTLRIYAMSRGHRGDLFVPHKQGMLAWWPRSASQKRWPSAPSAPKISNYGCRTSCYALTDQGPGWLAHTRAGVTGCAKSQTPALLDAAAACALDVLTFAKLLSYQVRANARRDLAAGVNLATSLPSRRS